VSFIRVDDGYHHLINLFQTADSAGQDGLFDQWRSLPPADVQAGLVSGNFHRGIDGRSVINYAQWTSVEHYQAFRAESATRARMQTALTFSRMDSFACEVVHTWQPAPEISLDRPYFTVVVVVTCDPENQETVLREMTTDDPALADVPGYVSHAVLRELSGNQVIKYAQWLDEASFTSFVERPREPTPVDELGKAELYLCRIEYIRERS
jgi:quinol monooxygenase YgiN